jgi:5-(carboxyamino)imidazole ribonucleotide synthase
VVPDLPVSAGSSLLRLAAAGPSAGFPTVGVVGGGQLARMMLPAAVGLGVGLRVLAAAPDDAAARVVDPVVGDHRDLDTLRAFADGVDILTVEHEHVPQEHLRRLAAEGVAVRPGADALVHAQDKLVMRERLAALGMPVPRWARVGAPEALLLFGDRVGWPVVVKRPRGGYDGRGVAVVDRPVVAGSIDGASPDLPAPFDSWWADGALLAEERVPFDRELAVLVARSPSGQVAVWPVVQTRQVDGICREVVAPAPDLSDEVAGSAALTAARIAGQLDVVGVLAVEGFEVDDRFLVNELAMRPHNSGHWTVEGSVTSQFEQHLRAVLDLPLGAVTARDPVTVMVNVLGADHPDLYPAYRHVMAHDPGVKVHLYGKEVRRGRKIGHVTVSGGDAADLLARARHAADYLAGTVLE